MNPLHVNRSDGEIWFQPCRFDGSVEDRRHPFTGELCKMPRNGDLIPEEQRAVEAALEPSRMPGISSMIEVADGGVAELSVSPSSVMLKPRRARRTLGLAAVLFEVLRAGNWCIRTDEALVVANVENARHRPREDPRVPAAFYEGFPREVVLVESAAGLGAALGWSED